MAWLARIRVRALGLGSGAASLRRDGRRGFVLADGVGGRSARTPVMHGPDDRCRSYGIRRDGARSREIRVDVGETRMIGRKSLDFPLGSAHVIRSVQP